MLVCCKGWRVAICLLDNLNHAVAERLARGGALADRASARRVNVLCDLHDRASGLTWTEIRGDS